MYVCKYCMPIHLPEMYQYFLCIANGSLIIPCMKLQIHHYIQYVLKCTFVKQLCEPNTPFTPIHLEQFAWKKYIHKPIT